MEDRRPEVPSKFFLLQSSYEGLANAIMQVGILVLNYMGNWSTVLSALSDCETIETTI